MSVSIPMNILGNKMQFLLEFLLKSDVIATDKVDNKFRKENLKEHFFGQNTFKFCEILIHVYKKKSCLYDTYTTHQ